MDHSSTHDSTHKYLPKTRRAIDQNNDWFDRASMVCFTHDMVNQLVFSLDTLTEKETMAMDDAIIDAFKKRRLMA